MKFTVHIFMYTAIYKPESCDGPVGPLKASSDFDNLAGISFFWQVEQVKTIISENHFNY